MHKRFDLQLAFQTQQFVDDKAVVKAHVVGDQDRAIQKVQQLARHLVKRRGGLHHGVADACQALDKGRNAHARIDQRAPARHLRAVFDTDGGNLGDAVNRGVAAGGLEIQQDVAGQHGRPPSNVQGVEAEMARCAVGKKAAQGFLHRVKSQIAPGNVSLVE